MRLRVRKGELAPLGWPDYGSRLGELIGEPDLPRTTSRRRCSHARPSKRIRASRRCRRWMSSASRTSASCCASPCPVLLIDEPTPLDLVFDLDLEDDT